MQGPCEVVAGTCVARDAHPALLTRPVGPVRLAGKAEPIHVSQVLGVVDAIDLAAAIPDVSTRPRDETLAVGIFAAALNEAGAADGYVHDPCCADMMAHFNETAAALHGAMCGGVTAQSHALRLPSSKAPIWSGGGVASVSRGPAKSARVNTAAVPDATSVAVTDGIVAFDSVAAESAIIPAYSGSVRPNHSIYQTLSQNQQHQAVEIQDLGASSITVTGDAAALTDGGLKIPPVSMCETNQTGQGSPRLVSQQQPHPSASRTGSGDPSLGGYGGALTFSAGVIVSTPTAAGTGTGVAAALRSGSIGLDAPAAPHYGSMCALTQTTPGGGGGNQTQQQYDALEMALHAIHAALPESLRERFAVNDSLMCVRSSTGIVECSAK
jgi:hypothetical protein